MTVKVFIVDDHPATRVGIQMILEKDNLLEVVGMASHGRASIPQITSIRPDVVLLDYKLPDMSGAQVILELKYAGIKTPVLIYSGYACLRYVDAALFAGAKGYALKMNDTLSVVAAVLTIAHGGIWIGPTLRKEPIN